jgi:hypothetical protein
VEHYVSPFLQNEATQNVVRSLSHYVQGSVPGPKNLPNNIIERRIDV